MGNVNELQIFKNEQFGEVRVVTMEGKPWFVGKDVAETLGYTWNGSARMAHIPKEWQGVTSVVTPSGIQDMHVLSEQGLYFFLNRSDKPTALPFQKWIAGDILPMIRKTGGAYLTLEKAEEILSNPDTIINLATQIKELHRENAEQQKQIEEFQPKVRFADAISDSHTSFLIGELAKLLKQNGINIGQNRLFEWMRTNGYLISRKGTDRNMPTQRAMDLGLFEIKERAINTPDGSVRITKTSKVTGKGQVYFINKFLEIQDTAEEE